MHQHWLGPCRKLPLGLHPKARAGSTRPAAGAGVLIRRQAGGHRTRGVAHRWRRTEALLKCLPTEARLKRMASTPIRMPGRCSDVALVALMRDAFPQRKRVLDPLVLWEAYAPSVVVVPDQADALPRHPGAVCALDELSLLDLLLGGWDVRVIIDLPIGKAQFEAALVVTATRQPAKEVERREQVHASVPIARDEIELECPRYLGLQDVVLHLLLEPNLADDLPVMGMSEFATHSQRTLMSVYGRSAHAAWSPALSEHVILFSHSLNTASVALAPHPGSLPDWRGSHVARFCLLKKAERTRMTESSSQAMLWSVEAHQTSLFPSHVSTSSVESRTAKMQAGRVTKNMSRKVMGIAASNETSRFVRLQNWVPEPT
eukprot:CAMPEP_0179134586 /NCGR_PEP_ID=MMETSP0796-20121207/64049_1 /TAXON_ID=73915 /ORGANISM="Pyrodinium bahamense, Strain pbaha01" /LENGTH=373 /DNA_ID=CAMNT_0020833587 /DNA_START=66 /DNA_END=1184 /DNA_ORIENTATION=-